MVPPATPPSSNWSKQEFLNLCNAIWQDAWPHRLPPARFKHPDIHKQLPVMRNLGSTLPESLGSLPSISDMVKLAKRSRLRNSEGAHREARSTWTTGMVTFIMLLVQAIEKSGWLLAWANEKSPGKLAVYRQWTKAAILAEEMTAMANQGVTVCLCAEGIIISIIFFELLEWTGRFKPDKVRLPLQHVKFLTTALHNWTSNKPLLVAVSDNQKVALARSRPCSAEQALAAAVATVPGAQRRFYAAVNNTTAT